jgi:hypothetical protein
MSGSLFSKVESMNVDSTRALTVLTKPKYGTTKGFFGLAHTHKLFYLDIVDTLHFHFLFLSFSSTLAHSEELLYGILHLKLHLLQDRLSSFILVGAFFGIITAKTPPSRRSQ